MKKLIEKVLARYSDMQLNLASETARWTLASAIEAELMKKIIRKNEGMKPSHWWELDNPQLKGMFKDD
jgi:hypothetical protein